MTFIYKKGVIYFTLIASSILLPIIGCTAGPDFKKPESPKVSGYVTGGTPEGFVEGLDIPGEWWALFHSKALNALIERSLKNNPDIKATRAALLVALENVLAQKGAYYPSVAAYGSVARQRTSQALSTVPNDSNIFLFTLYTPQVTVSYVPDVFGLNRRTVESLQAQVEQSQFALIAAHITLATNVVLAAIQEASLRAQIDATRQLIAINSNLVQEQRSQFAKGNVGHLDVASQELQLAQVSATLPPLLKQLAQQRDLLAALSGSFPNEDMAEKFEFSDLQLPKKLPLTLPSKLVDQRPDVCQAEANLHAASAQIGIAIANRLPNFALTADAGNIALASSQMFSGKTAFWTLAGTIAQPIFQGGTLLHKEQAARLAYIQAEHQYYSVVLTAFQNVADTLNAVQQDADALTTTAAAMNTAKTALDLTVQQWQFGNINYLALLNAKQTYQQAVISYIQAQANQFADTAALFQALGGGWWNRADLCQDTGLLNLAPDTHKSAQTSGEIQRSTESNLPNSSDNR